MMIKEVFTGRRYSGREWLRISTIIYVWASLVGLFAPLLSALFSESPFFAKSGSWIITVLSASALLREFFLVHSKIDQDEKRRAIRTTLAMLNHIYQWKGNCRITLFVAKKCKNNHFELVPYERIVGGSPPGIDGCKISFSRGEGVPGQAWASAWNGSDVNQLADSFIFGDVPKDMLQDRIRLRDYFCQKFKVTEKTFDCLSDEKYTIASYLGIAILNLDMSLAAALVIDSDDPDKFVDFKLAAKATNPAFLNHSGMSICMGRFEHDGESLGVSDGTLQMPIEVGWDDVIHRINSEFQRKISKKNDADLPDKIKEINQLRAVQQTVEMSPANIQAALLPLEWTLKCLREMKVS